MIANVTRTYVRSLLCLTGLLAAMLFPCNAQEAFSPSKSWKLAFVRKGDIWVANGDGTKQMRIIQKGMRPCWSPDRKHIAFVRDGNIWVADASGQGQRQLTTSSTTPETSEGSDDLDLDVGLTWDPMSDRIMFSQPESYQVTKRGEAESMILRGSSLFDIAWKPDTADKPALIYDLSNIGAAYHFSNYNHPAWSKDGKLCVYTCNGDIRICMRVPLDKGDAKRQGLERYRKMDVARLAAVAVVDAPKWHANRADLGVTCLSWSPDASFLVYGIQRLTGTGYWTVHLLQLKRDKYSQVKVQTDRTLAEGTDPCVSPDGRFIVYTGGNENTSGGFGKLCVVTVDGKHNRVLIGEGEQPAW